MCDHKSPKSGYAKGDNYFKIHTMDYGVNYK
jgi:hypothetical protein